MLGGGGWISPSPAIRRPSGLFLGGEGVVLGLEAEPFGGLAEVPAHAVVVGHSVGEDELAGLDIGLDGSVEEADQVAVGEPEGARPVRRARWRAGSRRAEPSRGGGRRR